MVRYLDLIVLVVVALPVFLLADLPLAAYLVGGGAWIVQRVVQVLMQRRAEASDDPRVVAGWTAGSMIARGWFCASRSSASASPRATRRACPRRCS